MRAGYWPYFLIALWVVYFLLIDPLEKRLLSAFLRWGEPNAELLTQAVNLPGQFMPRIIMQLGLIIGLILYPIVLTFYLLLVSGGQHQLNFLEKWCWHIRKPLSNPYVEGGGIYSQLQYLVENKKLPSFGGKLFWANHFQNHGVKYPKIHAILGKNQQIGRLPAGDFITKPEWGSRGRGIEKWKWLAKKHKYQGPKGQIKSESELIYEWKTSSNNILITDIVSPAKTSPHYPYPQHVRIVTYREADQIKVFIIQYNIQFQKGKLQSNHAQKAVVRTRVQPTDIIDGKPIPWLSLAMKQACQLHSDLPVFSVGWDAILTDTGPQFLEGNLCHTLGDYYEFDTFYQSLAEYDQLFRSYVASR